MREDRRSQRAKIPPRVWQLLVVLSVVAFVAGAIFKSTTICAVAAVVLIVYCDPQTTAASRRSLMQALVRRITDG